MIPEDIAIAARLPHAVQLAASLGDCYDSRAMIERTRPDPRTGLPFPPAFLVDTELMLGEPWRATRERARYGVTP